MLSGITDIIGSRYWASEFGGVGHVVPPNILALRHLQPALTLDPPEIHVSRLAP